MRDHFKILLILLFSYPLYILIHNLLINGFNLLNGSSPFFYSYGFICSVDQNFSTITYYSILFLIKIALFFTVPLFKIHLSQNILLRLFGVFLILLFSFEILNFITYTIDLQIGTFYRSFFFVSSGIYALSLALNLTVLMIPILFLGITFFLIYPLLKIKKTKQIALIFALSFLSVLGYALIFENILIKN